MCIRMMSKIRRITFYYWYKLHKEVQLIFHESNIMNTFYNSKFERASLIRIRYQIPKKLSSLANISYISTLLNKNKLKARDLSLNRSSKYKCNKFNWLLIPKILIRMSLTWKEIQHPLPPSHANPWTIMTKAKTRKATSRWVSTTNPINRSCRVKECRWKKRI